MTSYHKHPFFSVLVAFAIFGCGYISADDKRIENEDAIRALIIKELERRKIETTDLAEVRHDQRR